MKKTKRFLALIGALGLVALYVSTIVFALMDSPIAFELFKISLLCTIIIPILLYAYILIYRILHKSDDDTK